MRWLIGPALRDGALHSLHRPAPPAPRAVPLLYGLLLTAVITLGLSRAPLTLDTAARLQAPSASHPFGTDALGRDVLARVAHGALTTLGAALAVSAAALLTGVLLGLLPRLSGPLVDTVNAVPPVLVALLVTGVAGSGPSTPALAAAAVAWAPLAAHTSALLRQERATLHLTATRALGAGPWYLLRHELLPAVLPPVVRHALLRLPGVALNLAALGFLGLGAQPPSPEWGRLLAENQPYVERAPGPSWRPRPPLPSSAPWPSRRRAGSASPGAGARSRPRAYGPPCTSRPNSRSSPTPLRDRRNGSPDTARPRRDDAASPVRRSFPRSASVPGEPAQGVPYGWREPVRVATVVQEVVHAGQHHPARSTGTRTVQGPRQGVRRGTGHLRIVRAARQQYCDPRPERGGGVRRVHGVVALHEAGVGSLERLEEPGDRGRQVRGVDGAVCPQGRDGTVDGRDDGPLLVRRQYALGRRFGDLVLELERDKIEQADRLWLEKRQTGRARKNGAAQQQSRHRPLAVSHDE